MQTLLKKERGRAYITVLLLNYYITQIGDVDVIERMYKGIYRF